MAEKSENLRSELREGNRRLQELEWQSTEVQTALKGFRSELERFTETSPVVGAAAPNNAERLELRIDNLARGVQVIVAALRSLSGDIGHIKRNLSSMANATK